MRSRAVVVLLTGVLLGTGVTVAWSRSQPEPAAPPVADVALVPSRGTPTAPAPASPVASSAASPAAPPTPAPPPPPPPPPSRPPLPERLAHIVAAGEAAREGPLHVAVLDEDGQVVYAHRHEEAVLPASTQKLVTAAAALVTLGPDYRYRTRLATTVPPTPDGIVDGDLVLVGSGDPALATPIFGAEFDPARPRTPLEALADGLVTAGVREVTGAVLGDASAWANEPVAPGWLPRYFDALDTTRASALTADGGRKLTLVRGRLHGVPAPDPAAEAAASLIVLLRERGVAVHGGAASTFSPPPTALDLAAVDSAPLHVLLRHTLQESDNHIADAIFRTIGAAAGDPTWRGSARAVAAALAPLRLPGGAVFADGSGLSRDDRLPSLLLAVLQQRMWLSSPQWPSLLALSGDSGTLQRRLRSTVATSRFHGKTGSLRDVRSLAGTVVGPGGRAYHFSLLAAGLDRSTTTVVRDLQDDVVLALAEELYDCVRVPIPPAAPGDAGVAPPASGPVSPAAAAPPASEPAAEQLVCAA